MGCAGVFLEGGPWMGLLGGVLEIREKGIYHGVLFVYNWRRKSRRVCACTASEQQAFRIVKLRLAFCFFVIYSALKTTLKRYLIFIVGLKKILLLSYS